MIENEFLLQDRLQKIKSTIEKYGQDNFYLSFSGGKDSTVLSALLDMAVPGNTIPRVYANTGIEYRLILDFVEREREKEHAWELIILKPTVPIKQMLEKEGYPFKSKMHARAVREYKKSKGTLTYSREYYEGTSGWSARTCPLILKYQFETKMPFNISEKCCNRLKKDPLHKWQKETGRDIAIIGIMPAEGGQREKAVCSVFSKEGDLKKFQPLVPVTKAWEDWFISEYNIEISDIYKPPYNFERTGCKGCPFALHLQAELDTLDKFFPQEKKQCEIIWAPVYAEYRRLGYRLRKDDSRQMSLDEFMEI